MGALPADPGTALSAPPPDGPPSSDDVPPDHQPPDQPPPDSVPPDWSGLPIEQDTTDLRAGPEISQRLLALLPLVGVWRGTGGIDDGESVLAVGAQTVFAHDGRDFLSYEQRIWADADVPEIEGDVEDGIGLPAGAPVARESGYWRRGFGQDAVEAVIVDPAGGLAGLTGVAGDARYELASDVRANAPTGRLPQPERRMYAVHGDRLLIVGEVHEGGKWRPHVNLSLRRIR